MIQLYNRNAQSIIKSATLLRSICTSPKVQNMSYLPTVKRRKKLYVYPIKETKKGQKTMTKKETKTNKTNEERIAMENTVIIAGVVNRVINKNKYSLKTTKEITKKDGEKILIDFYITFVDFNNDYEVDDKVVITGYLSTNSYDGKNGKVYETLVNVTDVKEW